MDSMTAALLKQREKMCPKVKKAAVISAATQRNIINA
jgi:hypothetical protein